MPNYRRAKTKNGTYFFTVVTFRRQKVLCDEFVRNALRAAIRRVQSTNPFTIDAWVLVPDHLHCIWSLPPNDANFSVRWAMIKRYVTKVCGPSLYRDEWMTVSKRRKNESTVWQRRFWEHQIRDEQDYENHMDYIHYNPVKHGLVECVGDWPYSTFHRYVQKGVYSNHWGSGYVIDAKSNFGE